MSGTHLIREPSWGGLDPALPGCVPAYQGEADFLRAATGLDGRVFALTFDARRSDAMYCIESGAGRLFVKLVDASRRQLSEQAANIGHWLVQCGIPAAVAFDGYPRPLPDGRVVLVMPFLEGRRVETSVSDMRSLGAALSVLHRAFRQHPARATWQDATSTRLTQLQALRMRLAQGQEALGPEPARLAEMAADSDLDFILERLPGRPLHGDMNPGNVLVVNGQITWLDFEDVFHSVLPPIFELALVIERFVLVRTRDDREAVRLGRAFLGAYEEAGSSPVIAKDVDPAVVLRSLALRSLLVLASGTRMGVTVSKAEWNKFFGLEQHAAARGSTIHEIFDGFGACPIAS